MKLQNKKTGEIKELPDGFFCGDNLKKICEEWQDYEEPKEYWAIDCFVPDGDLVSQFSNCSKSVIENRKSIGNYFDTREEAEKAVEKLKAWKRLKEAGFEFRGWTHTPITKSLTGYNLHIKAYSDKLADYMDDLQLLFGGEK